MSWHLALHADLVLKGKTPAAWRGAQLSTASLSGLDVHEWSDAGNETVDAYLSRAETWNASSGHEFLSWRLDGGRVELRGLLSEGSLPGWIGSTLAALVEAGRAGGVGKGLFFGMANPVAYELVIGRKPKWNELVGAKIALAGEQRIVKEIAALSAPRIAGQDVRLDATTEPELALEVWRKLGSNPARIDRFLSELARLRT